MTYQQAPQIPNYLTQAILVTLCCCLPLGIVAILKANKVNEFVAAGNFHAAHLSSLEAKKWCWIAFGLGLPITLFLVAIQIVAAMAQGM